MLNVLSLFSGIGAFEKALVNLNIEHTVLGYCEIDKYASKAYSIIHNISEDKNLKDVTRIDILDIVDTVDLITYGFPCQDISLAGKGKGFIDEDGNRTRSGLFFEALRIIEDYKPKFAIAENVKALTNKRYSDEFKTVLESLEQAGYNNYWKVLNAKDYGVPQNRERVFIISIRKDIDKGFIFPSRIPLELQLKDLLENKVDEKYYLSEKMLSYFDTNMKKQKEKGNGFKFSPTTGEGIAKCISTKAGSRMDDNFILIPEATKRGFKLAYEGDGVYINRPHQKRGCVQSGMIPTLKTNLDIGVMVSDRVEKNLLKIRKLTPCECWRLMGFDDTDYIKVREVISDTQLYKQAGNSIVVDVLMAIFASLGENYEEFRSTD